MRSWRNAYAISGLDLSHGRLSIAHINPAAINKLIGSTEELSLSIIVIDREGAQVAYTLGISSGYALEGLRGFNAWTSEKPNYEKISQEAGWQPAKTGCAIGSSRKAVSNRRRRRVCRRVGGFQQSAQAFADGF